jgi:hypothetical protein
MMWCPSSADVRRSREATAQFRQEDLGVLAADFGHGLAMEGPRRVDLHSKGDEATQLWRGEVPFTVPDRLVGAFLKMGGDIREFQVVLAKHLLELACSQTATTYPMGIELTEPALESNSVSESYSRAANNDY